VEMNRKLPAKLLAVLFVAGLGSAAVNGRAQDKPVNNLESVHEKLKADKKSIVTKYMDLTESEAQNFWPVYEDYQKDLQKFHERLGALLKSYAAESRGKSLTDEKAKKLLDEWLGLEQDEIKQRSAFISKVTKALPAKKAARYLQIENEYRMLLRYDLATTVPLAR